MADDKAIRRAQLRRVLSAGKDAALAGRPVNVCPYPPGMLRDLYVRGYVAGRRELRELRTG